MTKFGLAQPVRRVEDPRLLVGGWALHRRHRAARHAVGRRAALATRRGAVWRDRHGGRLAIPGVVGVYTGADLAADGIGGLPCAIPLKNRDGSPRLDPPHPVLADGVVRHVGDPVAFVVAETQKAARDGAEAILVDYEVLESVTDLAAAMDPGGGERVARGGEQCLLRLGRGRQGKGRRAVRRSGPRHTADGGEQPSGGEQHGGRARRWPATRMGAGRSTPPRKAAGC